MNIIKLKDILMKDENPKLVEFYNKHLKGKYAWWIQMRYIVPFEFMGHEGYVACEEDITKLLLKDDNTFPKPYGCPYIDMYSEDRCIINYIDHKVTDEINNPIKYKLSNQQTPDEDLTIEMIKQFRSWLAQALLDNIKINEMLGGFSIDDFSTHTILYYANDMYNDCVKYLSAINEATYKNMAVDSHCSCCESMSNIYKTNSISTCNALDIYKDGIRQKMISIISNVDMWIKLPKQFLQKFKQYLENIVRLDLKINNKQISKSVYLNCICNDNLDTDTNKVIIQSMIKSLDYIIKDSYNGHYNYIKDSFVKWANIYEYMRW